MTKRERQLHSMLNYFEISTGGTKDETMNGTQKKKFIDSINSAYDSAVIDELISKIKGNMPEQKNDLTEDDILNGGTEEDNSDFFPEDLAHSFNEQYNPSQTPKNTEVEEFLMWLSGVLYSSDHKVTVTTDKNGTYRIKLEQIKRRGRK